MHKEKDQAQRGDDRGRMEGVKFCLSSVITTRFAAGKARTFYEVHF